MVAKKFLIPFITVFSLAAVWSGQGTGDRLRASLKENQYVAHEWGTFSSLQGSDGTNQMGLHHGDETLPRFVHCPLGFSYGRCLSLLNPQENTEMATTQRMETPVIYFYSKAEQNVDVQVNFPKGLITEWFPKETAYSPKAGDITSLQNGYMSWRTLIRTTPQEIPPVDEQDIWHAQRQVDANFVTTEGQNEKFIFYRGIGRFEVPFTSKTTETGRLQLTNSSNEAVPSMLLLNFNGTKGSFRKLGALASNTTMELAESEIPNPSQGDTVEEYVAKISESLYGDLTTSGLFPQEARAMVNTWKRSYFQTPGLRVLYVLPRAWVDEIVPLQMKPVPTSLVRTFVGRLEVFTQKEEVQLLHNIRKCIVGNVPAHQFPLEELGRFAEPKLWRLKSMTTDEKELAYILELISYTFQP